jgi:RNA polymerase sigma-70 factor (ECF subfamily)
VHGLVALMEMQASRMARAHRCRRPAGAAAGPGPRRWDHLLIRRGLAALERAASAGRRAAPTRCRPPSPPATRAPAAGRDRLAAHRRAVRRAGAAAPSPVVELNRAVALGMAYGPAAGLALVDDSCCESRRCATTTCCPACAATCWPSWAGDEARKEFDRAASLTRNTRERALLLARARACSPPG